MNDLDQGPRDRESSIFSIEQRDYVRDRVLDLASRDERIVAGAIVGSLALDAGDRWSDLDLTFGVRDDVSPIEVLDGLSSHVATEFDAVKLFDLASGAATYRVLLLPGCLQFDLSVSPASAFTLVGPKVKLLFGDAIRKEHGSTPEPGTDFGYAVHHLVRARFCVERNRFWQAEYWISSARDLALQIACNREGLDAGHGRGFDQLPRATLELAQEAIVRSPETPELRRALQACLDLLLEQAGAAGPIAAQVERRLRSLIDQPDLEQSE